MQGDWNREVRLELLVKLHEHTSEIANILC